MIYQAAGLDSTHQLISRNNQPKLKQRRYQMVGALRTRVNSMLKLHFHVGMLKSLELMYST
jgi:hypothetical protein